MDSLRAFWLSPFAPSFRYRRIDVIPGSTLWVFRLLACIGGPLYRWSLCWCASLSSDPVRVDGLEVFSGSPASQCVAFSAPILLYTWLRGRPMDICMGEYVVISLSACARSSTGFCVCGATRVIAFPVVTKCHVHSGAGVQMSISLGFLGFAARRS